MQDSSTTAHHMSNRASNLYSILSQCSFSLLMRKYKRKLKSWEDYGDCIGKSNVYTYLLYGISNRPHIILLWQRKSGTLVEWKTLLIIIIDKLSFRRKRTNERTKELSFILSSVRALFSSSSINTYIDIHGW